MNFDYVMLNIIFFLLVFLLVYIVEFYIISKDKTKYKKRIDKITSQDIYLINRFNLDDKRVNIRLMNFHVSIINAFIISSVTTIISLTKLSMILQLLIGFVLLFALIYSLYELYGRHLKKKWGR